MTKTRVMKMQRKRRMLETVRTEEIKENRMSKRDRGKKAVLPIENKEKKTKENIEAKENETKNNNKGRRMRKI